MGWFVPEGPWALDPQPRQSVLGVLRADAQGSGKAAGSAVLLAGRMLLTCAHVVNEALGLPTDQTTDQRGATVAVVFGLDRSDPHNATVRYWVPKRALLHAEPGWVGDLAVLELDAAPPPRVKALRWQEMATGQEVVTWYRGYEYSVARATVVSCDGPQGFLDGTMSGAAIREGYSGGPLCLDDGSVVGLTVAQLLPADDTTSPKNVIRRSISIPWQRIRDELAAVGAGDLVREMISAARPAADATPSSAFEELLSRLFGDPAIRSDRSRQVAARYSVRCSAHGSPTIAELTQLLASHPRMLPDFVELHAPTVTSDWERDALSRLAVLGNQEGIALMLSEREHKRLLAVLRRITRQDSRQLPQAIRSALPFIELPQALAAARMGPEILEEVVYALEGFVGDCNPVPAGSPRVPALLRVVEYLAALADAPTETELQAWNDGVAQRLGVHPTALAERRADAAAWASSQQAATRIVVHLAERPEDPPEHFRYAIWRRRADGTAARVSAKSAALLHKAEIARLVREEAENSLNGSALVEVFVDSDLLHLPIDEWDDADAALALPTRLGEEFHVVMRCRDFSHRSPAALTRRWTGRTSGEVVIADAAGYDALVIQLKKLHCCGRVVLHGPPTERDQMMRACLALGVPIVLWDRSAEAYEDAHRLDAVEPIGSLSGLPERLRQFRVDAYADPGTLPTRPSLVWEDPDYPAPEILQLADPADTRHE